VDLLGQVRNELAFEGNVWKSYLYRFLMNFQLWWPIWVIYLLQDRDLSLTQITFLDTPFFILIVLAEVPTGAIADRLGRKVALMMAAALFAVAIFVFGIADSYLILILSYTAWGLALTLQMGADSALLYDSLKAIDREDDFQKINGRLWAITSLAVLIAILVGAPLAEATSLSFPIIISAGIALLAIPVAWSMHEPRHETNIIQEAYVQTVINGVRDAWRQPALRYIIIFSGVIFAMTFAPLIFVQPFLDQHGVEIRNLGIWQAPVRAAGIVSALLAYRFVSGIGQKGAFFAMPVALGICYLSLAGIDHIWLLLAFLPVGMVAGMQNPVLATYINRRIPSERRATMLSIQSMIGSFLLAILEPMSGLMADTLGLRALFLAFGIGILVVAPAILLLWLRAESEAGEGEIPLDSSSPEPVPAS
jgi:MFS family permease